jgi:phage shock protein PspC (stress-responsive transcriptional regulator)
MLVVVHPPDPSGAMPETTASAPPPPTAKRLTRSRDDRLIAGVCAGIARYFGIDPVVVRVATVVLIFFGGVGALAYLAAILLVPEDGEVEPLLHPGAARQDRLLAIAGIVLLGFGVVVIADRVGLGADLTGPVILLAIGGALLYRWFDRRDVAAGGVAPPPDEPRSAWPKGPAAAPRAATQPTAAAPAPEAETLPVPRAAAGVGDAARVHRTDDAIDGDAETLVHDAVVDPEATRVQEHADEPARSRRRSCIDGLLIAAGVTALAIGAVAAIAAVGGDDVNWGMVLAGITVAIGAALVVASFFGGAPLLVVPGIAFAGLAALVIGSGVQLDGGWGDEVQAPRTAAELDSRYEHGVGRLAIDLRDVPLPAGRSAAPRRIEAELGVGQLLIVVPPNATTSLQAEAGVGAVTVFGRSTGGVSDEQTVVERTGTGAAKLEIDAHVGVGEVRLVRPDDPEALDLRDDERAATRPVDRLTALPDTRVPQPLPALASLVLR